MSDPVAPAAEAEAVETVPVAERDRWARLYARKSDDYDEIGMGVMEKIADGGSLADVLHFVADHFDTRDHTDEESQALYERAKVAASRPPVSSPVQVDGERLRIKADALDEAADALETARQYDAFSRPRKVNGWAFAAAELRRMAEAYRVGASS